MPERAQLEALIAAIDEGFCLAEIIRDPAGRAVDYRFIEVNGPFAAMTGLQNATGRRATDLVPDLEPFWIETYGRVAAGETMRFEAGSEAMGRHFDVFAAPVKPEGRFVLVFRDVTARLRVEREREEARRQAESLVAEVNHRVMNTLAMITAIVRLETQQVAGDDGPGARALARLQNRLAAVASLYRALNSAATATEVRAAGYLGEIARSVAGAVADGSRLHLDCDIADLVMPVEQAVPLALLVNELMTNALKYAFPDGRSGRITVSLTAEGEDWLRLTVSDDGIGLGTAAPSGDGGIGSLLLDAFAEQIGGRVARSGSPAGTRVAVTFPREPVRPALAAAAR